MSPIPIFYRPEMSAHADSFSASSSKPTRMVEHWLERQAIKPADIRSFEPVSVEQLATAHDEDYVRGVLELRRDNGFGGRSQQVADALPYTSGSMLAAALHVAEHGGYACSPSSGFHHAGHAQGGGFCTFNGLMVAAIELDRRGLKVGILDCDAHYGDGTQDIISRLGLGRIQHHTMGRRFPPGQRACFDGFWGWLRRAIGQLQDCDVVLYQAGADPLTSDPLGGQLSMMELYLRDFTVVGRLKRVAWNLAGGYSGWLSVSSVHTHTLQAFKEAAHD